MLVALRDMQSALHLAIKRYAGSKLLGSRL